MYFVSFITTSLLLSCLKTAFGLPLNGDSIEDHLSCGMPRKIPPIYSRHEYKDIYEFNWMVTINEKIQNTTDVKIHPLYDGILIHPRAVLTNARLLENLKNKPITVKISQIQLSMTGFGLEELHEEANDVIETIFHPQYEKCSLNHDLALLILAKPFDLHKNANTICLPERNLALEEHLNCKEIPFSLHYRPFKKHGCPYLLLSSKNEPSFNEYQESDEYKIRFNPESSSSNSTDTINVTVETSHFFCQVGGRPSYFYGGTKTQFRSYTYNTYVLYNTNDNISDYLMWVKSILADRLQ